MASMWDFSSGVGILGSGDFSRALATRCYNSGIDVTIGSRRPDRRPRPEGDILAKVKVTTIDKCIQSHDLIFVAMHAKHHSSLGAFENELRNKILVDISNTMEGGNISNAENLASILPSSRVIKAFNTVSAYDLSEEFESSPVVYICGDDVSSKTQLAQLTSRLGLSAVDAGKLDTARRLEQKNRELFPGWGWPSLVLLIISLIWLIVGYLSFYLWRDPAYSYERIPTNVMNKITACISISCLSLVYLPGCFAGFTQLRWGTKHRRFGKGLDRWLRMRKQLGLFALLFAFIHMILSTILMSPAYMDQWYLTVSEVVPANQTSDIELATSSRMTIVGEICILLGIVAISLMGLVGITSIPSVGKALNWREWRCVHTYIGFFCLFFSVGHVTTKGSALWGDETITEIIGSVTFLCLLLPWFTAFLRICLFFCHRPLMRIRGGWVRGEQDGGRSTPVVVYKSQDGLNGSLASVQTNGQYNQTYKA